MILGVGTDLVSIDRIVAVIERYGDRFIDRCFAVEEQVPDHNAAHYAKRWAAKEAVAKAMGLGIDAGVYLRDIVVIKDPRGAPRIELRNGAARLLAERGGGGALQVHLSLSDDGGFALAFVVIEA